MKYRNLHGMWNLALPLILLSQGCSVGLEGGSIEKNFIGIQEALVMGPETVDISWITNKNCTSYQIYSLSNSSTSFLQEAALPPVRLDKSQIVSETSYDFSVACVKDGNKSGQDVVLTATTWGKFNGLVTSSLDEVGTKKLLNLKWSYKEFTGTEFKIYAKKMVVPGDLSQWQLTSSSLNNGYKETPICSTFKNEITIGNGGDCNPSALKPGETYNFKVVANYPDQNFSTDYKGNGTTISIPAAFNPPKCVLTQAGIGSSVDTSYLFLRCGSNALDQTCSSFKVQAFQSLNDQLSIVSDLMTGPGTLRIQPKIDPNSPNSRTVEGLQIEYTCTSTTPNTVVVVRYDQTTGTNNRKPILKYGNIDYEKVPEQSYLENPSKIGRATAIGDFNCNGFPDLAIGLPNVTYNLPPYFNQQNSSGVVKVIYDYATNPTSSINLDSLESAGNVQYLSFRDLPSYASFGKTLSAGNINKDIGNVASQYYNCDDLIIGAPGGATYAGAGFTGAAFVFYGHPKRFAQPLDYSGLASNAPTCTGNFDNQVCSPVRLSPDVSRWLKVDPNYTTQGSSNNYASGGMNGINSSSRTNFGFQVSYIRDFNADGYGDIAVTDPYCDMDGEIAPGVELTASGVRRWRLTEVGCVYVYWGGPTGLQVVKMGRTPDGLSELKSPMAIIYPPVPQEYMHFGWSISGGGDVNVAPPVPVKMNGTEHLILANGNDFIVGAPDFSYQKSTVQGNQTVPYDAYMGTTKDTQWTVNEVESINTTGTPCGTSGCPVDPLVLEGPDNFNFIPLNAVPQIFTKMTMPWNLAWNGQVNGWTANPGVPRPSNSKLKDSTGIAFLYLGRSPIKTYNLTVKSGFRKFPNLLTDAMSFELLSQNLFDRQNGSDKILWDTGTTYDWKFNPVSSFYNCGSRGNPRGRNDDGFYKGISCFAGRNNTSWIYPSLKTTDSAVLKFGSSVTIAGSKEQNLIALYELGDKAGEFGYSVDNDILSPRAQGGVHESIRGQSLWEVSVVGLNSHGTNNGDLITSTANSAQTSNTDLSAVIARSSILENFNFNQISSTPYLPMTDSNNDGYADVVVGTAFSNPNSKLFAYYGNYAADFSYQGSSNSSSAACLISKDSDIVAGTASDTPQFKSLTTTLSGATSLTTGIKPYSTFSSFVRVHKDPISSSKSNDISFRYPYYYYPINTFLRLKSLDDVSSLSTADFGYSDELHAGAQSNHASANCKPLMKNYSATIETLTSMDMNNDGFVDVLLGLPSHSTNNGRTAISYSNNQGRGIESDVFFQISSPSALIGSSISATNWKFIDGSRRRDLFSGSPGYLNGNGVIHHYMASGANAMSSNTIASSLFEDSNFPNDLRGERSKIIGDINGDGFDDILMPVRRVGAGGFIYYQGMIYFGSSFGSVSYSFCKTNLTKIKLLNNSSISLSDCIGSETSLTAKLGDVTLRLPQLVDKPLGVGSYWILNPYKAGDVDRDGYEDLLILDMTGISAVNSSVKAYLFFGSSNGIINGTPVMGESSSSLQKPQLISEAIPIDTFSSGDARSLAPSYYYYSDMSLNWPSTGYSLQNVPLTTGDYNNDGYQDLAIGYPSMRVPGLDRIWKCSAIDKGDPTNNACFQGVDPQNPQNESSDSPGYSHGGIIVLYGSLNGYQTYMDSNGQALEIPNMNLSGCKDFYQFGTNDTCTYDGGTNASSAFAEVYDVLHYNNGWKLNTDRSACKLSNGQIKCKISIIRNPVFFDFNNAPTGNGRGASFYLSRMLFGSSLSTADINADGVDDLIVGHPRYFLPGYFQQNGNASAGLTGDLTPHGYGTTSKIPEVGRNAGNTESQGRVFTYFGSSTYGLVAPNAKHMVGDIGLGIKNNDSTIEPSLSTSSIGNIAFGIYPAPSSLNPLPQFDRSNNLSVFPNRNFGINMTTGDFNGDGKDDVAIVSLRGQLYVYYGPVCAFDNGSGALIGANSATPYGMYRTPNLVSFTPSELITTNCTVLNLKDVTGNGTTLPVTTKNETGEKALPQMITVQGASSLNYFGSMLLSRRPDRKLSGEIKYPGNMNGDSEKTSDLIIGSSLLNDPNVSVVSGKYTGIGYLLFGHKKPNPASTTEMSTNAGLFVGNANYNSTISSIGDGENTKYFYSPMLLKPHSSDGLTGKFMLYESTLGDINGDGTGDILFPTTDIHFGSDQTPVIDGGGFKIVY